MTNEDRIEIVQSIISKYHKVWDERFPDTTIKKLMENPKLNEEFGRAIWDAACEAIIEEGKGVVQLNDPHLEDRIRAYWQDIIDIYLFDDGDDENE